MPHLIFQAVRPSSIRRQILPVIGAMSFMLIHATPAQQPSLQLAQLGSASTNASNATTVLHSEAAQATLTEDSRTLRNSLQSPNADKAPIRPATAFPTTSVGITAGSTVNFSTTFSASTTVTGTAVLTQGASNSDFKNVGTGTCDTNGFPYTYAASASCTTVISFTPSKSGNRQGAEILYTSTPGSYYYGLVNGIGNAPQLTYSTGTPAANILVSGLTPFSSALDGSGNLWITDATAGTVNEFVPTNGVFPSSPTNIYTGFTSPQGIVVDGLGSVYVGDGNKGYVWRLTATNGVIPPGTAPSAYVTFLSGGTQPIYVSFDPSGSYLYFIGIYSGSKYLIYCTVTSGSCALLTTFTAPAGMATDTAGYKYILDSGNVYQLPTAYNSTTKTTLLSGLTSPSGIAIDAAGDMYIASQGTGASGTGTVTEYLASNGLVSSSSSTRQLASGLYAPSGVTLDTNGNLFIADTSNNALKKVTLSNPPTIAFPDTVIGHTSTATPITLQNIGNTALNVSVPTSGSNPAVSTQFGLDSSGTCPIIFPGNSAGTLAYGSTCTYVPAYIPSSTGAYTGALTLTDNNLTSGTSKQSIKLTGNTGGLTIQVIDQIAAQGNTAVPFEVLVGYGAGAVPSVTPTVKVNGSATGVGAVTCINKVGHQNCTLNYDTSSLIPGLYTITATVAANGSYSTTSGTGSITIVAPAPHLTKPVLMTDSIQPAAATTTPIAKASVALRTTTNTSVVLP